MNIFNLIVVGISVFSFNFGAAAQTLNAKDLRDMRGSTASSCFKSQRTAAINAGISDSQIRSYCTCYANELITPSTTVQDVQSARKALEAKGEQASLAIFLKGRNLVTIQPVAGEGGFPMKVWRSASKRL